MCLMEARKWRMKANEDVSSVGDDIGWSGYCLLWSSAEIESSQRYEKWFIRELIRRSLA